MTKPVDYQKTISIINFGVPWKTLSNNITKVEWIETAGTMCIMIIFKL